MDCSADSISSISVNGRFSSMARDKGFDAAVFAFGLPRSEVNFPGPFLRWPVVVFVFVMRRTLEGDGVREGSAEERLREADGDMGGA